MKGEELLTKHEIDERFVEVTFPRARPRFPPVGGHDTPDATHCQAQRDVARSLQRACTRTPAPTGSGLPLVREAPLRYIGGTRDGGQAAPAQKILPLVRTAPPRYIGEALIETGLPDTG
jgi:hypothetical protein